MGACMRVRTVAAGGAVVAVLEVLHVGGKVHQHLRQKTTRTQRSSLSPHSQNEGSLSNTSGHSFAGVKKGTLTVISIVMRYQMKYTWLCCTQKVELINRQETIRWRRVLISPRQCTRSRTGSGGRTAARTYAHGDNPKRGQR